MRYWVDVEDDEDPLEMVKDDYAWDCEEIILNDQLEVFEDVKVMTVEEFNKEHGTPHERQWKQIVADDPTLE